MVHLERGREPALRRSFERNSVPQDVIEEFLRLERLWGRKMKEYEKGMFSEMRLALECYRAQLTTNDPAKANEHSAAAKLHERESKNFEGKLIEELRGRAAGKRASSPTCPPMALDQLCHLIDQFALGMASKP